MAIIFNYIIKKIINIDNNIFSPNYDNSDIVNPIFKLLFYRFIANKYTSKFNVLKETLHSFLDFSKDEFINYFCRIQKIYHSLSRFSYLYKYKKSKLRVTTDMLLNNININNENVLCLYHINSRYLFNVNDLLKIINTSLINNHMFFAEPLPSKNPYNNLPFTKSNLYNIFFFIKYYTTIYNDLFFKFFDCHFNLTLFYNKFEYLLRENSIKNFIRNASEQELLHKINMLLQNYNNEHYNNKINIHDEFPKNKLIKIMKPYLLIYLNMCYSLIPIIKKISSVELNQKLIQFQKFNPQFGRRTIKMGLKLYDNFKKKTYIKERIFNDKHIVFNFNENAHFLSNHLTYNDDINYNSGTHYNGGITHHTNITNIVLLTSEYYIQNENNNNNMDDDTDSNDEYSIIEQTNLFENDISEDDDNIY